jgi:type IV secretory pathway ATPase VirB11/archaellum biosynthesis ATPase
MTTLHFATTPQAIEDALRAGKGILVAGPTNTGKTTFLSDLVTLADGHGPRCVLTGEIRLPEDARRIVELSATSIPLAACIHAGSSEAGWARLAELAGITLDEAKTIFPVVVQMARDPHTKVYTIQDVEEGHQQ